MNIALIFAGGAGTRMNSRSKPKQFLELHGKATIVYTLEVFEKHPDIDAIVVVCLEEWIEYMKGLVERFGLKKVKVVIPGGKNTQQSQYLGLCEIERQGFGENPVVLIHDGVRPLVDADTVTRNIDTVRTHGTAITVAPAIETILYTDDNKQEQYVVNREKCKMAKAPQSFFLKDVLALHRRAIAEGLLDFIDSACMFQHFNHKLHTVEGGFENIKITTAADFYIFRALLEAKENTQILGL